jgi:hypothetical protein
MEPDSPLGRLALDSSRPVAERIEAISALIETNPGAALPVLLEVGSREEEPAPLLQAVGAGLARIDHEGTRVTQFVMSDLADVAYKAFCDWEPLG